MKNLVPNIQKTSELVQEISGASQEQSTGANEVNNAIQELNVIVDQNTDAVAVTASGITFSFSVSQSNAVFVDFNAEVEAHFYPEKSWYLKDKGDDHILAHEQLHFDITELHVRQLRFNISRLKVSQNIKISDI